MNPDEIRLRSHKFDAYELSFAGYKSAEPAHIIQYAESFCCIHMCMSFSYFIFVVYVCMCC